MKHFRESKSVSESAPDFRSGLKWTLNKIKLCIFGKIGNLKMLIS